MFPTSLRTHTCGDLSTKEFNKKVTLCGWVATRRDHGGIIFIDLRDRYGITQIVFDPKHNKESHKSAEFLRREDCIQVEGKVKKRKKGMENKRLATGKIEIFSDKLHVFSKSEVPPIEIDDNIVASEEIRLKYRYLDLRRPIMQRNLLFRQKVINVVREYVNKQAVNKNVGDFPILSYKESKEKYGNDKPDLRFGLELHDVTEIVKKGNFSVFNDVIKNGGIVKCINPEKEFTRNELDAYSNFCVSAGAKGMAYLKYEKGKFESNIVKFFSDKDKKELINKTKIKKGYLFFVADKEKTVNSVLSELRLKLGRDLALIKDELRFCWVTDFPLFSYNEDEQRWEPEHHMFTMPKEEHLEILESNPGKVLGNLFDLVLNGTEVGSGSIRISRPDVQERVMKIIGMKKEEARKKFGFLLEAYEYAGPVHGGMGLGFDRFVALLLGGNDIREVIAFPKNKSAQCPMDGSPAEVDEKQLREANIKLDTKKK